MHNSTKLFAQQLKEIRINKKYTREYVFDKTGIHTDTLRRIEKGENIPRIDTLEILSKEYGVNLILLLNHCQDNPYLIEKLRTIDFILSKENTKDLEKVLDKIIVEDTFLYLSNEEYNLFKVYVDTTRDWHITKKLSKKELINNLMGALKEKNGEVDFNNLHLYHFTYFEKRVLYLVASILLVDNDLKKALLILNYLDEIYEKYSLLGTNELLLNIMVKYAICVNHCIKNDFENTLKQANIGIELCNKNESTRCLYSFLYLKGYSLYMLKDPTYKIYFEQYINQLEISDAHETAKVSILHLNKFL